MEGFPIVTRDPEQILLERRIEGISGRYNRRRCDDEAGFREVTGERSSGSGVADGLKILGCWPVLVTATLRFPRQNVHSLVTQGLCSGSMIGKTRAG